MGESENRLAEEKSPYLLQHADNPVDWYPWGEEAFNKAKNENKPVFLSIGYSTCHWCHVMAHESFENKEVANILNESFVSIKVDREERPDIDGIYMSVCQTLTGSGGWPLTVVMTPDKKPFFAATYIPKESRFGRVGMLDLIPQIKLMWDNQRDKLLESAESIVSAISESSFESVGSDLKGEILDAAFNQLFSRFDKENGGFGTRPKFPTPHNLFLLLRYWKRSGEKKALEMVEKTIDGMSIGGVYDHIGYGIHRYSTDENWLLPHFEKMLYDQALFALACIETYQATGHEKYKSKAEEIFTYVLRDMTSPDGGFYSAEDADSEGIEGKFYIWSEDEIKNVLGEDDARLAFKIFNTEESGNFKEEATGRKTGENILHLNKPLAEDQKEQCERIREKLFKEREKRIHPHKDDKILTDWNGLMIAAFARGGQVFDNNEYIEASRKAADFIIKNLTNDKRLLHRFRDGESGIDGNLDDYAFLIWGLLELYESTFDLKYIELARGFNDSLKKHFFDEINGGYFFTADDTEELIIRKKEIYDGAIPSGNSVMILNLLLLSRLTNDSSIEELASKVIKAFSGEIIQTPLAYTFFLTSFDFALGPSYEVIITGDQNNSDTKRMLKALRKGFNPNNVVILKSDGKIPEILEFLSNYESKNGKSTAYVCVNYECKQPTTDINKMLEFLD